MTTPATKSLTGVVVSAGLMMRAVKVRTAHQAWDNYLQKNYTEHKTQIVSDPTSATRLGDVVRITTSARQLSPRIRHYVSEIVVPWGLPLSERPKVMSELEREEQEAEKRAKKAQRRALNAAERQTTEPVAETTVRIKRKTPKQANKIKQDTEDDKVTGVVEGTMIAS